MRINGRKINFTREDVLTALRCEMVAQGEGDSAFEITDNLELTMNSAGGIEVKPHTPTLRKFLKEKKS